MSRADLPTLIQVLSSPHSGSTILGVVLGSAPDIFYGGEMDRIPAPIWRPGLVCSCGVSTATCPFWAPVRRRFETSHDSVRLEKDQRRFETWGSLWRTVAATVLRDPSLGVHAEETQALLQAVAEVSGKTAVVDSSKFAGRGLVYSVARSKGLNVRYVHLVRDGRSVMASRKARWRAAGVDTESAKFARRSALRWLAANLTFSLLFSLRRGRYLRVRHEDLLRDPVGTLERLERFIGVSLAVPKAKIREGASFGIVHVPAGNRFRLAGEVQFKRGGAGGSASLTPAQRRAFWRVAGTLARFYGYDREVPAEPGEGPVDRSPG